MNKQFFKTSLLLTALFSLLIFFGNSDKAYAYTSKTTTSSAINLGKSYAEPENGWSRHNNTDNISYIGNWNSHKATSFNTNYIKFNFVGSDFRLLRYMYMGASHDYKVSIDGILYTSRFGYGYSAYAPALIFEINNLKHMEHSVIIYTTNANYYNDIGFNFIDINADGSIKPYNPDLARQETLSLSADKTSVTYDKEFTIDVVLDNGKNICAEDLTITYDKTMFEYLEAKAEPGIRIYHNQQHDTSTTSSSIRLISTSLGKDNAINGEKSIMKLKFRSKKEGSSKIDILNARIADNGTFEKDIPSGLTSGITINVGPLDVNKDGEFSLLDLGIGAWYYDNAVSNTDTAKYNVDIVEDGWINDLDLTSILEEIFNNPNYPNN